MAGDEIGMAIDLGISAYDHSCRPNCSLIFNGFHSCLRPLTPDTDASNPSKSFISYIDVGRSRYQRRKELKAKWYFDCECERCTDPADDILTSIKCLNQECDEPLIIREDSESCATACKRCKIVADQKYIETAQKMMLNMPTKFNRSEDVEQLKPLLEKATKILHAKNIYVTRLQTAIMSLCDTLKDSLPFLQKQVYENYKMCFPKADRHIGYQLIRLAITHIEKGEREQALPYAYEAMNVFEVCFGLEHPYYLQILALWTFLDTNADKTDEELIALTNFTSNQPVDLSKLFVTDHS